MELKDGIYIEIVDFFNANLLKSWWNIEGWSESLSKSNRIKKITS